MFKTCAYYLPKSVFSIFSLLAVVFFGNYEMGEAEQWIQHVKQTNVFNQPNNTKIYSILANVKT
jgi:hypothetical protein